MENLSNLFSRMFIDSHLDFYQNSIREKAFEELKKCDPSNPILLEDDEYTR